MFNFVKNKMHAVSLISIISISLFSGFLLFSMVYGSLSYNNFIKMHDCVVTDMLVINWASRPPLETIFQYTCNYTKSGHQLIHQQACWHKNTLNCHFNYNDPDIVGKTIDIGLNSWTLPIIQYVFTGLIFILSLLSMSVVHFK